MAGVTLSPLLNLPAKAGDKLLNKEQNLLMTQWTLEAWQLLLGGLGIFAGTGLAAAGWRAQRIRHLLAQLQDSRLQDNNREHQLEVAAAEIKRLDLELEEADRQQNLQRQETRQHWLQQHEAEKRYEVLQVRYQALREQADQLLERLQQEQGDKQKLLEQKQVLAAEHAELKTGAEIREESLREQLQQLNDSRQLLAKEFENLANRIFDEKSQRFAQSSQAGIDSLLMPFRQQIEGFQKRVNEVHDAAVQGNASLNAEIRKVLEAGLQMSADASSLVSALKGDSQQRGAWGEAQLRRTLEMSGLVEGDHYEVQSSFRDDEGRLKQTDYLIKLPDGKHIVIDSKVTLNAYEQLISAQTPEQERQALVGHVQAVRRHIDDLTSKDYSSLAGLGSPNFVLMFMPVEPAFIEALKHDRELYEYGYRKNVVLVSHTTLIPVLRTVSNLWMVEHSQQEAREISDRAGDIYNQVCIVAERLARLGTTLGTVSTHYNSAVTALAGQQGLHGKVERFARLSARVNKQMPSLEPRHLDFESARLQIEEEPG